MDSSRGRRVALLAAVASFLSLPHAVLSRWLSFTTPAEPNLALLTGLIGTERAIGAVNSPESLVLLAAVGLSSAVSYGLLRYLLWWLARGRPGAGLILGAAVLGTVPLVLQAVVRSGIGIAFGQWTTGATLTRIETAVSMGWMLPAAALVLLGAGLVRTRLVWPLIGAVGIVAGLGALIVGAERPAAAFTGQAYVVAVALEWVFLLGLCGSLVVSAMSLTRREDEPVQ